LNPEIPKPSSTPADIAAMPPKAAIRKDNILVALVKAVRPKQATKNLFVYTALVFAGQLFQVGPFLRATIGFLLFTAVAGSVYLLNDLLDVKQDRLHPKKKYRPIAYGSLPVPLAWIAFVVLGLCGTAAGFALSPLFGLTLTAYFVLQIAYCFRLKHIVLLDVFTVAAGFVLRTASGGFAIDVHISPWLILFSLQLALFLGFGKRRQELVLQGENAGKTRAILSEYSLPFLDPMIMIVVAVTIVCYSVYSVDSSTAITHPHLWVTVPFMIYGVCRYLYLVYQKGWGGAPDEVLLKDRELLITVVLWFLAVMLVFKFDVPGSAIFHLAGWK
jgi:4-hydroxybenzoate polyprenyltransferase